MKRIFALVAAVIAFAALAPAAHAGPIILSSDSNIGDSTGIANAGNQQFFRNVLAGGNTVAIGSGSTIPATSTTINNFYNSQAGVTSSILAGPVTAASLTGVELFIGILPSAAYSAAEITALSNFLAGGGTVFFIGENSNFPNENARISAALAALGSTMSIVPNTIFDSGFQTATGSQIAANPYTAGITAFVYAAPSLITVGNGTALFFGTGGQPFIAVEGAAVTAVPEPATLAVFGLLAVGAVGLRRRKAQPAA